MVIIIYSNIGLKSEVSLTCLRANTSCTWVCHFPRGSWPWRFSPRQLANTFAKSHWLWTCWDLKATKQATPGYESHWLWTCWDLQTTKQATLGYKSHWLWTCWDLKITKQATLSYISHWFRTCWDLKTAKQATPGNKSHWLWTYWYPTWGKSETSDPGLQHRRGKTHYGWFIDE